MCGCGEGPCAGATPPLRAAQPPALSPRGGRLHTSALPPSPSQQGSTALDEVKAGAAEAANTAAQAAAAAREYDSLAELFGDAQAQFGLEVEPEPEPAAPPLSA